MFLSKETGQVALKAGGGYNEKKKKVKEESMVYARFYAEWEGLEQVIFLPVLKFEGDMGFVQSGDEGKIVAISSNKIKEEYGRFTGYYSERGLTHELEELKKWTNNNRSFILR